MRYFLAMLPILVVLGLMIWRRWGAHRAGMAGWVAGLILAATWFGLTPQVLWVSQAKGLLLSLFVLAVMWPALFLYHWLDQSGGITAVAHWLADAMPNRGMCLILLAWSLSGLLEGLAGFGLPIAVVAPMLTALGVRPVAAVAAVAAGHAWAVTFGDMGVILQTLVAVTGLEAAQLIPWAALLLGVSCLLCGLAAAFLLGEKRQWPRVASLSVVISGAQYGLAAAGLAPLAAFGAGLAGLLAYLLCARVKRGLTHAPTTPGTDSGRASNNTQRQAVEAGPAAPGRRPAILAVAAYGSLTVLMAALTLISPLRAAVQSVAWKQQFPAVESRNGTQTPAGPGQALRPLAHPGTLMLVVACAGIVISRRSGSGAINAARQAAKATAHSAGVASVGVLSMVGLSTLMDHCGMTYLLAEGLSRLLGGGYPLVSPWVGILGAFATGSNNNSNVLFGSLQKNAAVLLGMNPDLLVAAQTAGGSLGSMLAPAKIIVGCSTVNQGGQEGRVLRQTVPLGLAIGLAVGLLTFILSRLR